MPPAIENFTILTNYLVIGAVLMVAFRIVGPQEALQAIDFATIVLLFSMMLVVANLRVGGFFERIAEWAIKHLHPHHLLPTVIFTSGLLSAFLVNDIVCLVMTPFVVHMTQRLALPPVPYVVAVATALGPTILRRDDDETHARIVARVGRCEYRVAAEIEAGDIDAARRDCETALAAALAEDLFAQLQGVPSC